MKCSTFSAIYIIRLYINLIRKRNPRIMLITISYSFKKGHFIFSLYYVFNSKYILLRWGKLSCIKEAKNFFIILTSNLIGNRIGHVYFINSEDFFCPVRGISLFKMSFIFADTDFITFLYFIHVRNLFCFLIMLK